MLLISLRWFPTVNHVETSSQSWLIIPVSDLRLAPSRTDNLMQLSVWKQMKPTLTFSACVDVKSHEYQVKVLMTRDEI